ncbi:MAG TPA: class I SAM-dependent methyltransferase [Candidatus Udaeobacter sp.]|nr:class I SAM-dependent methyltransferase [Candidatus Udaeobacter sp.]
MQFRHKIRKLVDGRSLVSARKHTLRLLRTGRFPLNKKRVIETIDPVGFGRIRKRYAIANPGADWPKYLDLDRWIPINIRRIRQIELDLSRPRRILDLGCGAGYFLYIAQLLGHSGVGLDMDRLSMFREVTRLLGVRRIVQRIEAFQPLPDFEEKFDVITAFMICFNNHKMPDLWKIPEWEFFLDDLAKHLTPRGRVWLELNQEYDGTFYTPELKEFFQSRGARINQQKVTFSSGIRAPASTLSVAR